MNRLLRKSLIISSVLLAFQAFAQAPVNDSDIVKSVQGQISNNPLTSSTHVTVDSQSGDVVLTGVVDTGQQASALVQMSQSTPGVTDVNTDNLKIKDSKHPITDTMITAKIKGLFLRDKLFSEKDIDSMSIKVETKNGVVHLAGSASSTQAQENAINTAKSVKGVKKVVSHIKVAE